jgi:hypothetical protein
MRKATVAAGAAALGTIIGTFGMACFLHSDCRLDKPAQWIAVAIGFAVVWGIAALAQAGLDRHKRRYEERRAALPLD